MHSTIQHSRLRLSIAAVVLLTTVACSDSDPPTGNPPNPVASVVISPVEGTLWAGDARQLAATPRAADGTSLVGRQVTWSSGNEAVAVVDGSGRLEARGAGSAVIAAASEGKRGEVTVTVSEADLIFEGNRTGLPEAFVLSLRGGEPTRALPPNTHLSDPTPSPDGRRIAFVVANYAEGTGDIYVIDRDGTNLRQLTVAPELDDQPAWSPDGTKITFRSFRTQYDGDIWVMNADGTNPVNLTPDPLPGITNELRPAWSPDGSRIAYASNAGGDMDLWTMRADGSDKRRITNTPDYDTEPTWSPDGQRIAFRRASEEFGADLAIVGASGGAVTRIPHPGGDVGPAWSPDGRLIAFTVFPDGGGRPQIYTMRPDGTEITLRTTDHTWNGGLNAGWIRRQP